MKYIITVLVCIITTFVAGVKLSTCCIIEKINLKIFALSLFQALATAYTLRRFCSRRILATHESAVFSKTPSVSASSRNSSTSNPDCGKEKLG